MDRVCAIVPSIRELKDWVLYLDNFERYNHNPDIIVIDEDNAKVRSKNKRLVPQAEFYGVKERDKWFRDRHLTKFAKVIPKRSHAETSFGLLVAYERDYDMVLFIDDDTQPFRTVDFLGEHWNNLSGMPSLVEERKKWVKVTSYYPRGYPYSQRMNGESLRSLKAPLENVLNQGLWTIVPDMNAVDILHYGGLDGTIVAHIKVKESYTVPIGAYATVCSMNLAFRREIIPAFYQLVMGTYSIDRFDDIWSGVFVKKVLDQLGKGMSYGKPLCKHNKVPRDVFKDTRAEMEGLVINEKLWKVVDQVELTEDDYLSCYRQLAEQLHEEAGEFHIPYYIKFMCKRMVQWTKLIEKLL